MHKHPSLTDIVLGTVFTRWTRYSQITHATSSLKTSDDAREWARRFVHWYNVDHRHSGIRYVSPAQRHAGEDSANRQ